MVEIKGKMATCNIHMFDVNSMWSKKLRVWGEAGVIAEGKDSKIGDRGSTMMFVGYAENEGSV